MSDSPRHSGSATRIGEILLDAGVVTSEQVDRAVAEQKRTGERLGITLVRLGYLNHLELARAIARQQGIEFCNLIETPPPPETARLLDEATARRQSAVPVRETPGGIVVAFSDPLDSGAIREVKARLSRPVSIAVTGEYDIRWTLDRLYIQEDLRRSAGDLVVRRPHESAAETFTTLQIALLFGALVLTGGGLLYRPLLTLTLINAATTAIYLGVSIYRLHLMYRGASHRMIFKVPPAEIAGLKAKDLPVYTILIPLFRETEVLPGLLKAIANLDYPASKLDIKLLFEESDRATLESAKTLRPPPHFEFVIVPDSLPRTKPKACNYGLIHAAGEYCVIYDAEDIPEPDQLKKAVVAFHHAPENVVCLQSKLNYYNRHQNTLTRWFTTEYSMWFDLVLPGLDATGSPIPLGGTSNHFVTKRLRELSAWDPFNVTEDADLGVRLHKAGYRTAVLDSTTFEEAVSSIPVWIAQRSRWVKGYMQTWLVHMRNPAALWRALGPKGFLSFNLLIGATAITFLVNPVYWILTLLWLVSRWDLIPLVFPPFVYYLAALCLILGNFVFMYVNVAGSMRRGYHELVRYALVSPVYWILMSIAAWRSLQQLIVNPYYWDKTAHGLNMRPGNPEGDSAHA